MAELTIDRTYAKGLFLAAKETAGIGPVREELEALADLFHREPAFFEFFCSPVISGHEKKKVARAVLDGRIRRETLHFLLVLIDKGRTRHFDRILQQYVHLQNESEGFTSGLVYSASPLAPERIVAFEERTGALLSKKVKLRNRIDPSLLGGVRIFVDGKMIDDSVKKRLEDLMETLQAQ